MFLGLRTVIYKVGDLDRAKVRGCTDRGGASASSSGSP